MKLKHLDSLTESVVVAIVNHARIYQHLLSDVDALREIVKEALEKA